MAFGYDPEAPVLKDVSFTITPGQLVGIVGTTGGGKSTVVSLIPRFYDPIGGRVLIDGIDLKDLELASLRAKIGYVLQDTVLFHGTVRENIAYGRPECDGGGDRRRRQARQRASSSSPRCRTATTRWSATAGSRCRAASGSASASRGR